MGVIKEGVLIEEVYIIMICCPRDKQQIIQTRDRYLAGDILWNIATFHLAIAAKLHCTRGDRINNSLLHYIITWILNYNRTCVLSAGTKLFADWKQKRKCWM